MARPTKHKTITCQYFTWRIYQRDGVWYADGRSGDRNLGRHSLGTRNQEEALIEVRELDALTAVQRGQATPQTVVRCEDISIDEGWQRYLEYSGRSQGLGGVAPDSLKRYKSIRDKHVPWCQRKGFTHWRQFDRKIFEQYGDWMFRKYAYRTCYTDLTQIKSVINWLINEKLLPEGSRVVYKLQKAEGSDTYCPCPEEVEAMIARCRQSSDLQWLGDVLFALAHLGLRISELAELRWSDIDLVKGFVVVADERASRKKTQAGTARTTKGRRSRVIPIHPDLTKLLAKIDRRPDGRVFHSMRGARLHQDNARHIFIRDVVEPLAESFPTPHGEIGFADVRFHSFRHYFCSQCFLGGASEGEIREWMGHRDSQIVELYRHLRPEDAARKMQRITFMTPASEAVPRDGVA